MNYQTNIEDFNYSLPAERIALYPCPQRDQSKLLIYKGKQISEDIFANIADYLSNDNILVFNDTKVVQARLIFHKPEGATVEIFCLEPLSPTPVHALAFEVQGSCRWLCYIGNNKRLKNSIEQNFDYHGQDGILKAERIQAQGDAFVVEFSWNLSQLSFGEILEQVGKIPLPPYIKRQADTNDSYRYQTIFAQEKGSVAAPTAGLHFTDSVLQSLNNKHIQHINITLHVGAGTFKPVTEQYIEQHVMHTEPIFFNRNSIELLLNNIEKKIITVGTTSTRSLESLYWIGVKIHHAYQNHLPITPETLHLTQWEAYTQWQALSISPKEALQSVLQYMNDNNSNHLQASTAIMITPYYQPKLVNGLVTNFHQPKSTLMLLIAAFVHDDWKQIYNYALSHNFRFLSYGDACLFL